LILLDKVPEEIAAVTFIVRNQDFHALEILAQRNKETQLNNPVNHGISTMTGTIRLTFGS
jgi:hypothetical protein